jgi:CBS domain-containing protein
MSDANCKEVPELQQRVADLMTTPVRSVRLNTPLREVVSLMQNLRVRHMPVVDDRNRLRGLITHRDVISAHYLLLPANGEGERNAGQLMTRELDTVERQLCLHCAAVMMFERKRGCLPVIDSGGRLIGILTEADFVRRYRDTAVCALAMPVTPATADG